MRTGEVDTIAGETVLACNWDAATLKPIFNGKLERIERPQVLRLHPETLHQKQRIRDTAEARQPLLLMSGSDPYPGG